MKTIADLNLNNQIKFLKTRNKEDIICKFLYTNLPFTLDILNDETTLYFCSTQLIHLPIKNGEYHFSIYYTPKSKDFKNFMCYSVKTFVDCIVKDIMQFLSCKLHTNFKIESATLKIIECREPFKFRFRFYEE